MENQKNDGSNQLSSNDENDEDSSRRRSSRESRETSSLGLHFQQRQSTPAIASIYDNIPTRSNSVTNISYNSSKNEHETNNCHLNGIDESPRDFYDEKASKYSQVRRCSLQASGDQKINFTKEAFGPQLASDSYAPIPGTPLPSLVQEPEFPGQLEHLANRQDIDSKSAMEKDEEEFDPESLYFRDGKRKIDMVLVYEEEELGVMTEAEAKRRDHRRTFQENLIREGLEVEVEHKNCSFDGKTWFLKVHLPWKTKTRYAELMGLKLPIKRFITISVKAWDDEKREKRQQTFWSKVWKMWRNFLQYNTESIEEDPSFYAATEGADREEQFVVKDRVTEYSSAQRSMIVMQILLRVKYDETDKVGIRRLLNDNTYLACFPLHEGDFDQGDCSGRVLDRRLLYLEWARPSKWMKKQPLGLVRKYFGDKIGLYFCWLGFYTKMLYAPAIVGFLCFMYGLLTIDSLDNRPTLEICNATGPGNITLCPLCDKACKYQRLIESCKFARLTYLFDNPATVFFAIFMSLWATVFLEMWRRKQKMIQWEWDLQGHEVDEEPRPEFETSVKTFRTNPVTREKEPYLSTRTKTLRYLITGSAIALMLFVVLCAVLGTIIYRLSLVSVIYGSSGYLVKKHAKIVTSASAALINLIIIMCLTRFYHRLAIYLTNLENPRTLTEYEDSYTFKIFVFEFLNFYSSLIYIAFFKGRFFDYPGDIVVRKSEFFRVKGDVCDPAGCLSELCIQLAIIMIGKQIFNNFVELFNPLMYNWWRGRAHRSNTKDLFRKHTRWEKDYHMQDPGRLALFDEYLEMILQYGFVTLFVAAFPLAPLCALLNNIAEIRLDAYKFVTQARRPLAERAEDIGAWEGILRAITYAAVVSNAFVIAYTSDFIPRMVYKYKYSKNFDLDGYIDSSLSEFNTSDYAEGMGGDNEGKPPPERCQYRGYRNGPDQANPYDLSPQYWHVFAARLAFVVIFEHIVFALVGVMQYVIPDIPSELKTQIQREALLAKEAKYEHGLKKQDGAVFDEILHTIRENNSGAAAATATARNGSKDVRGLRGSWARRLSRISDSLDAHVEVTSRNKTDTISSTVWEVT